MMPDLSRFPVLSKVIISDKSETMDLPGKLLSFLNFLNKKKYDKNATFKKI